jgi:hypothetical protein
MSLLIPIGALDDFEAVKDYPIGDLPTNVHSELEKLNQ